MNWVVSGLILWVSYLVHHLKGYTNQEIIERRLEIMHVVAFTVLLIVGLKPFFQIIQNGFIFVYSFFGQIIKKVFIWVISFFGYQDQKKNQSLTKEQKLISEEKEKQALKEEIKFLKQQLKEKEKKDE